MSTVYRVTWIDTRTTAGTRRTTTVETDLTGKTMLDVQAVIAPLYGIAPSDVQVHAIVADDLDEQQDRWNRDRNRRDAREQSRAGLR